MAAVVDPQFCDRYYCVHNAGLHAVVLPWIKSFQQFCNGHVFDGRCRHCLYLFIVLTLGVAVVYIYIFRALAVFQFLSSKFKSLKAFHFIYNVDTLGNGEYIFKGVHRASDFPLQFYPCVLVCNLLSCTFPDNSASFVVPQISYSVQLGDSTRPSQHPHFPHIQLLLLYFLRCPRISPVTLLLVLLSHSR